LTWQARHLRPFTDKTEQAPSQAIFEIDKPRNTAGKKRKIGKTVLENHQTKKKLRLCSNGLRYLRWGGDGEAVQPEK
jgi:hypothetical protein